MATVRIPSSLQAQMTRRAISPRLAMSIFLNMRRAGAFASVAAIEAFATAVADTKMARFARPGFPFRCFLCLWAYGKQLLPVFNRLAIGYQSLHYLASDIRFDFVHQLHRFHNAQDLSNFHHVSWLHKRW